MINCVCCKRIYWGVIKNRRSYSTWALPLHREAEDKHSETRPAPWDFFEPNQPREPRPGLFEAAQAGLERWWLPLFPVVRQRACVGFFRKISWRWGMELGQNGFGSDSFLLAFPSAEPFERVTWGGIPAVS